MYFARAAHISSAGIKCQHCTSYIDLRCSVCDTLRGYSANLGYVIHTSFAGSSYHFLNKDPPTLDAKKRHSGSNDQ